MTASTGPAVTVLAAQTSHQFTATTWTVQADGQLDVMAYDGAAVASFAPGAWGAVYQDSAVRT